MAIGGAAAAALIAGLIKSLPMAVEGLLGIIRAIQAHGQTDEESKAKLVVLGDTLGTAVNQARDIAARVREP